MKIQSNQLRLMAMACVATAAFAVQSASAKEMMEDDMYVGIGFGRAAFATQAKDGTIQVDETKTAKGTKFFYGYRFSPSWALESGYVKLGTYERSAKVAEVVQTESVDSSAWYLSGVYSGGFGKSSFGYAVRVGVAQGKAALKKRSADFPMANSVAGDLTSLAIGGSLQYNFSSNVGVRLDYDSLPVAKSKVSGQKMTTGILGVGVYASF